MIELSVLDSFGAVLTSIPLAPAPKTIGPVEPAGAADLPALVVSLEGVQRLGSGLGERGSLITDGALPIHREIDLANPFLSDAPDFPLVNPDRTRLHLPHGGLVRADAGTGALSAADLKVSVKGVPQTLVAANPVANSYTVDPLEGLLVFGTGLPPDGKVIADYFIGQWERRISRGSGVIRLSVAAADPAAVSALSGAVLSGLDSVPGSHGFVQLTPIEIGSITAPDPVPPNARRRLVRFQFEFEQVVDAPDSSGGIIRQIPVQALLS